MGIFEGSFVCFIFTGLYGQEKILETVTNLNASKGMFRFYCESEKGDDDHSGFSFYKGQNRGEES